MIWWGIWVFKNILNRCWDPDFKLLTFLWVKRITGIEIVSRNLFPILFAGRFAHLLQHCCHNNWLKAMPYQPRVQGFFIDSSKRSLTGILHNSNKYPSVHWEKWYKNLKFLLKEVKFTEHVWTLGRESMLHQQQFNYTEYHDVGMQQQCMKDEGTAAIQSV